MLDQADKLRHMMRTRDGRQGPFGQNAEALPPVLTVTSGKGGVGKSVLTANLALAFAREGKRVLIIDADCSLANLDIMFDCRSRVRLHHAIIGESSFAQCRIECAPGIFLVSVGTGLGLLADLPIAGQMQMLSQLVAWEAQADIVLVDTGAGTSRMVLASALAATTVLVVTTPEPTALTDAYSVIKLIRARRARTALDVVVNMAGDAAEAARAAEKLSQVSARFLGVPVAWLGSVPYDAAVPQAVRQKIPLVQTKLRGPARQSIAGLMQTIETRLQCTPHRNEAFFSAVTRLLAPPAASVSRSASPQYANV